MSDGSAINATATGEAALDTLDRGIVDLLVADARLSARAIARELGVAAGTVTQRISRLEARGVIRGYRADVEPSHLGGAMRFVIGLQTTQGTPLDDVLDELIAIPEVDEALVVTGNWDVMVTGRVVDPHALNVLLTQGLWQSPSFRHSETMIVIDERQRR